jgi:ABC-type transport system involved in multi-copper enzyme maturation permease subunit
VAPFGTLLRVELVKLIRRPMTWILALIFVGLMALIYLSLGLALRSSSMDATDQQNLRDDILLPNGLAFGVGFVASLGIILLIILAAGSYGSEFSWATIRTMLLMRAPRTGLLAAKLVALEVLALLVVVVGTLGTLAGAVLTALIAGEPVRADDWLTGAFAGDAAIMMLRAFIAIGFWIIIAATISVTTHSLAAGIGVTLAFQILGDIVTGLVAELGRIGEWVVRLVPNRAVNQLLSLNATDPPSLSGTDYAWITASLTIYTVVAIVWTDWRFRTMNIIAASA